MKLLRLRLENFRQHRDTDISFDDGMTAIVGVNGSGKTTILEAMTFALYGVQRKTKESIRFYWAEPRAKVRVTLDFEFEGRSFRLERTTSDATLIDTTSEPHITKATGLREVKAACERLLRLTYDQFKNSFCAEQKSLSFLQFNTDTRRQEQVGKMLGFDRLKGAADLARERGKVFRGIAEQLAATMGNIAELRADHTQARDDLRAKQSLRQQMEELRSACALRLPPAEERKKLADDYFRLTQEAGVFASNAEALKSSRRRAEEAVAKATADALRRKDLLPAHDEWAKLEESFREMMALRERELECEKIAAEVSRLESEIGVLDSRLAALEAVDVDAVRKEAMARAAAFTKAANALRESEASWSRSKQSAQAAFSTADAVSKQARQALAKAKDLAEKGICPECGQPTGAGFEEKLRCLAAEVKAAELVFAGAEKALKMAEARPGAVFEAEDAMELARTEQAKAQERLTGAEKADAEAKGLQADRASKDKRASVLRAELAKSKPAYDREAHIRAEARLRELRPKRDECLRLAGAEEALRSAGAAFEEAKKEIEQARASYQAVLAERDKLPFESADAATQAIADFEDARRKAGDAEAQLNQADALAKIAEGRLQSAEERINAYEQAEASLKEGRAQALLHETADKELKLLREELNSVIRPELEARASDNLSLLTNGRYPVLELDEEFNATVIEDGVPKQVISGGEEDIVALALRLALSELIQERQGRPMSLMILDEVFGSLDADRRQAVLERLQAIKGRFAQILVISHIEEINQVADHCIFLTRDDRSRSTVVGDLPLDTDELVLRA
ncbi:MAG: AAA family ATPase [Fimbriimonadales bacterium]